MDTVVNLLVENLTQLLKENYELLSGLDTEVKNLLSDLTDLKAVLKEAGKGRTDNEIIKRQVEKIRGVVNKAEDLIDKYVGRKLHLAVREKVRAIGKKKEVAEQIRDIQGQIQKIRDDEAFKKFIEDKISHNAQIEQPRKIPPTVEEEYVVGFDGEAETIIQRLREGSNHEVISVVGMPGLGKTTLANKIFKDSKIEFHFMYRAWLYVSKSYKRRDVFLRLLKILQQPHNYGDDTTEEDLAELIKKALGSAYYFFVLDDVWTTNAFDDLQSAFPKNSGSRILVTTRNEDVARYVNSKGDPHPLKFLESEESWELLQRKVFHRDCCPEDLKEDGKVIAKKCDGLPLAVVIIAGILRNKPRTSAEWNKVASSFAAFIRMKLESYGPLVELSYNHLPYDLKSCFIYLGAFPQGFEIPTTKLIKLWIAEGFIEEEGQLTMEDIAYEKLAELVNRNLVIAIQRKPNGQIKTCRIHDMLHEFCKNEAKVDCVFREINEADDVKDQLHVYRRQSVKCPIMEFISLSKNQKHIRSLLCFAANKVEMKSDSIQSIYETFPLLRVLHFAPDESVTLMGCPKKFTWLFHLRYLAISTNLKILPKDVQNLQNLQTLIIRTTESTLEIKGDIWSMSRLRHMLTNSSAKLPSPSDSRNKKDLFPNRNLQTLSRISPESCTAAALSKAPNIKKLGIRGNLAKLFKTNDVSGSSLFQNLGELKFLENLKLLNDGTKIQHLPQKYEFPLNLRKLSLSKTSLEWKEVSILGSLEHLEILKLVENAFKGEFWEPINGGFLRLQVLHIERTNLKSWIASKQHFPRLKILVLKHCSDLQGVPLALAEIDSLQEIDLNHTNGAINSAQEIKWKKQEQTEKSNHRFKLTIYPPQAC